MSAQRIALVITNSQYDDNKLGRLSTPDADAIGLKGVLEHPEICAFTDIKIIRNESFARVRTEIARLYRNRKKDDLILLYFSGHGVLDDNRQLYLAVKDTDSELLEATGIGAYYINGLIDNCRSRRQIVMLDCCHSGAFATGGKSIDTQKVNTGSAFDQNGYGYYILTATDRLQYAWEGDKINGKYERSLFTHHVVEGLRTGQADVDNSGLITIENLYQYVYDKVRSDSSESRRMTPMRWIDHEKGNLVVAHNKNQKEIPPQFEGEISLGTMRRILLSHLKKEEFRDIAFDLHIPETGLGETPNNQSRQILNTLDASDRLPDLMEWMWTNKPTISKTLFGAPGKVTISGLLTSSLKPITTSFAAPMMVEPDLLDSPPITEQGDIGTAPPSSIPSWWWGAGVLGLIVVLGLGYFAFSQISGNGGRVTGDVAVENLPESATEPAAVAAVVTEVSSPTPEPTAQAVLEDEVVNEIDSDGDGLSDSFEVDVRGTDPNNADSDGDGLSDGDEVNLYKTQPDWGDTDSDGASDFDEVEAGTDPLDDQSFPNVVGIVSENPEPTATPDLMIELGFEMIEIPAGPFTYGMDPEDFGGTDEFTFQTIEVSAFQMARYETTNAQYKAFLDDGNLDHLPRADVDECNAWKEDGSIAEGFENHPVVCIDLDDSLAFTEWLSQETGLNVNLPTESEWEKGARGASDTRSYPWGNEFDGTFLNYCDTNCPYDHRSDEFDDRFEGTAPVGTYPIGQSPYGLDDMAGNVWEWVRIDEFYETIYGPDQAPVRSGSYGIQAELVKLFERFILPNDLRNDDIGFRIAIYPDSE